MSNKETQPKPAMDGLLLVNKPAGITSFDVIRKLRGILKTKKMGHLGTLDPAATGLLPITVGKATRLSKFLMGLGKTYLAQVRLGWATTTYDAEGEVSGDTVDPPALSEEQMRDYFAPFIGDIDQVPPIYSAKKIDGKRLYDLAREGKEVKPKPARVTIYSIDLVSLEPGLITLRVASGAGMYVRSLAHDLGVAIGCGGHVETLHREVVGDFSVEDAHSLDEIQQKVDENDFSFMTPMAFMLSNMEAVNINEWQEKRLHNGNQIMITNPFMENGQKVKLIIDEDRLVAIGEVVKPLGKMQIFVQPKIVLK